MASFPYLPNRLLNRRWMKKILSWKETKISYDMIHSTAHVLAPMEIFLGSSSERHGMEKL